MPALEFPLCDTIEEMKADLDATFSQAGKVNLAAQSIVYRRSVGRSTAMLYVLFEKAKGKYRLTGQIQLADLSCEDAE